jgi:hypothetical protein
MTRFPMLLILEMALQLTASLRILLLYVQITGILEYALLMDYRDLCRWLVWGQYHGGRECF